MKEADTTAWTRPAVIVVTMVAFALVLDGLDAQALGLAIPALMAEWNLTRADFSPIAAGSLIGMAIGATFGGVVGDRIGRRAALIEVSCCSDSQRASRLHARHRRLRCPEGVARPGSRRTLPNASN